MEIKKINTTPGAADSAREGGEKINANFAAVKEELEALDMNKITVAQCEDIVKTISYTKSQSDGKYINKTGDASNATAAFVEATADAEITSGSTLSMLFGQTKRTFTSLWASLSGKLGKTEKAASATISDTVIDGAITTSKIADHAITSPKLASDLTLPGTPQIGTPSGLNGASQNVATIGNVNAAVDAVQIGGTNIYQGGANGSDFYFSATGEMKYVRFYDLSAEAKRNLRGQSLSVSFDYILENAVVGRGDTGFGFSVKYTDGTNTYVNAFIPAESTAVTRSGRFSATTKIEDKEIDNITSFQPFMYAQTTSGTATVGRPKFEIGTKATQWSPAPEEMARKSELETSISNIPAGNVRFSTGDSFEELYDRGELKGQPGETGPKGDKGDTGPSGLEAIGIRLKVDQGALYWSPESSGDVWHKIADSNNTHFGG